MFLLLSLLLFSSPAASQGTTQVEISVTGLDDTLRRNVLATLSLVKQRASSGLTDRTIQRLYAKADEEIKSALQPYGYYTPVISKDLVQKGNVWLAALAITLGEPVRVTELTLGITGDGRDEPALVEATALFPLKVGDVLDHRRYEEGKKKLTATALDTGFRDVSFTHRTVTVTPEKRSASVQLVLDTGPRYYFGQTTFAADFLSQNFLKRLLPYKEGEPFSPKALVELRQALLASDYFSDVDVTTGAADPLARKMPVLVTLKQRLANKYSFGLGYGTDTGARGSMEWASRLFNRHGHQVGVQLQPSERKNLFGAVYTIPIRDPRKDRLSLLGKWESENFETTETEQRTISLSYDHIRGDGEYSLYLAYLNELYDTGLDSGHASLLTPGIKMTWTLADDRLTTNRGIRLSANLTGAEKNNFSDTTFLQASVAAKGIVTFLDDWRAIGRLQVGATMVDNIYDLPPLLRFYAGGDQSVRGYAYKSIGPHDAKDNILGGRYLSTYSIEVERAIAENWSAALFFDSGDVFNSLPDLAMKSGCGIGIRWNLAFGQVRLDLAKGLAADGGGWRIHFNVGADL